MTFISLPFMIRLKKKKKNTSALFQVVHECMGENQKLSELRIKFSSSKRKTDKYS